MRAKKIDKIAEKHFQGACRFCGESDYALLDCHRITPGKDGGKYTEGNTVVICANCHRKVHAGQITIDRAYYSTAGKWILHYFYDGKEIWE